MFQCGNDNGCEHLGAEIGARSEFAPQTSVFTDESCPLPDMHLRAETSGNRSFGCRKEAERGAEQGKEHLKIPGEKGPGK